MLFSPITINSLQLANRTVRSATWEGLATESGHVTPKLIDAMTALAEGGVGLIISSHAYVDKQGQAGARQIGIYDDACVTGLRAMTDAVHAKGGVIFAQLAHAGGFAAQALTGLPAIAPGEVVRDGSSPSEVMSAEDIATLPTLFAAAAKRAKLAGFDGVQIHAAHGYCLSQFLSPHVNKRNDEYGGSIKNRARILVEVFSAVRGEVGASFPVILKINSADFREDGLQAEDAVAVVCMLAEAGLDAVELSGGILFSGPRTSPARVGKITTSADEAWYSDVAKQLKQQVEIPVILVGGMRSVACCEQVLGDGVADCVALCRPLIREPALIARWKDGDTAPAQCINCNACYGPLLENKGFYCPVAKDE